MLDPDKIWLLRHGQTDWNLEGRLQGRTDIPLNQAGIIGAHQAGILMVGQRLGRILSSPLQRAMTTAQIVAVSQGITAVADPRLIERDFGRLEGMMRRDILHGDGSSDSFITAEDAGGGAEPWSQVKARMKAAYDDLPDNRGPVLIVSHMAALTALTEALGYAPPVFYNSTPVLLSSLSCLVSDCRASS